MHVEQELAQFAPERDTVVTIGVFDGVHIGHRHLISRLTERAREKGFLSCVVTFREHPQSVLAPGTPLPFLTSLATREALLKEAGVDIVVALSFTPDLARLSSKDFASLLVKHLRMRALVVGPDFSMGCNREGNADVLTILGGEMGFSVDFVPPMKMNGEVVSSTAIREALARGDVRKAARLMGHPFTLEGRVVKGVHRGTGLGFPTANLDVNSHQAVPPQGVYATHARIGDRAYASVTNIGQRPTFGAGELTIEVFVLDYRGDLYGQHLAIDVVERLREEKRFASADELKQQISRDIDQARAILGGQGWLS